MITSAILDPLSIILLVICAITICLLPRQSLDAVTWWRDYLAQVLAALWPRFLVWRERWPDRVREAFDYRREPGKQD